ncbi:MAG: acetolactate synthase small subunit, partial [Candidatus Bathyarchaeia archaeon]
MKTFIFGTLVEHKPGVLQKVSNMFRQRNFNIESITVGPTERGDIARMTITMKGEEEDAVQLE